MLIIRGSMRYGTIWSQVHYRLIEELSATPKKHNEGGGEPIVGEKEKVD